MHRINHELLVLLVSTGLFVSAPGFAQDDQEKGEMPPSKESVQGVMTVERMHAIIKRLDPEFVGQPGLWQLRVSNIGIRVITDENADRMRIIIPIRKADEITKEELFRIMQANYDSALDARYAVGQGLLWSTFVHPLSTLDDRDFISGLGQAINIVTSYGKTYSSGLFTYGGGDSSELIEKQLIEELMEKGEII